MQSQLALFEDRRQRPSEQKISRSGTFVDNMALPIHRWFRYSAGFAAQWVEKLLAEWNIEPGQIILDPFVGSGTVSVVCDQLGVASIGVEAHPTMSRICKAKLLWTVPVERFSSFAAAVQKEARNCKPDISQYPQLIQRSFDTDALTTLDSMKNSWLALQDSSPESELVWLALTSILRPTASAGTAQWQYILPNKTKKKISEPLHAFQQQIEVMKSDIRWMQSQVKESYADIIAGDARKLGEYVRPCVDAVITSPPYANNYDYADALRFEMTFWGEVKGWGDIHNAVRKHLMVSSSQHASRERLDLNEILESEELEPIRGELSETMKKLAVVREDHGGKKHYHTMVGAYCRDISRVLRQLRIVCKPGAQMCWVIGDSAPYGVHCPIEKWIADLAIAAGFQSYNFEKLRDRNIKWKNRKHRVPLKEGLLWIEG